MALVPTSSLLFRDLVGTPAMRLLWSEERMIASWMDVERAITEVQAEMGMVPADAARTICACLRPERLPAEIIAAKKESVGHLFVSFLKAFREVCGEAAEHLHVGPTTQDILDTGLVLQMRDAYTSLLGETLALEGALCDLAERHAATPVMGRTHEQHAVPVTFGFVVAGWATELRDYIDRLRECEGRWMIGNLSGAAGAQNTFVELAGTDAARRLERDVCARLGLASPVMPLHARTDRFAELIGRVTDMVGSLGRVGLSIRTMQRTEVAEVEEPYRESQHWSSTMPNKKNPEIGEQVAGLATLCRGLAQSMQEIRVADYRDSTRLPVMLVAIPLTFMAAARAVESMKYVLGGLIVDEEQMRLNLDDPRSPGQAAAERVMIALYKKCGLRDAAHEVLHEAARDARERRLPLAVVLAEHPMIREHLDTGEIEALCDLTTYTGTAESRTADAIAYVRARQAEDLASLRSRPEAA
jgi:adenylosuccinate lyase